MTDWSPKWHPDDEDELETSPNVKVMKFGDGYEQRIPVGINSKTRSWNLKFTKPLEQAESEDGIRQILNFLEEKAGVTSFLWTDPLGYQGKFVCRKWNVRRTGVLYELSARFEEVFD